MPELVFEIIQESDGDYCAECLTESIFIKGDTWEELRKNVLEATSLHRIPVYAGTDQCLCYALSG
jgi:hypothetical protein